MNEHDTEKISGILSALGYSATSNLTDADIILLNTCSVREKSVSKVFTFLGRIKKIKEARPHLIIGVCGCVAQQEGRELFKKVPFIDFLLGPRSLKNLPWIIDQAIHKQKVSDLEMRDDFKELPFSAFCRHSFPHAYITIMEGCNRNCSYCIVPQTRGREVCRPFEDILKEAYFLAESGYLEIELLGQNVNAYADGDRSFVQLLSTLSQIDSLKRIRFTTSHPSHMTLRLMQLMKENEKICNYLHLPLQSGSSRILKLMRRGYSAEEYFEKVMWLKQNIKDFTLGTDIIVGFPTENDLDFNQTISIIQEIEFDTIYSFVFSQRPGTAACRIADDVPQRTKLERLYILQKMQNEIQKKNNSIWKGVDVEVLSEGYSKKSSSMLMGRTKNNKIVNFTGPSSLIGKLVHVKITDSSVHSLIGEAE